MMINDFLIFAAVNYAYVGIAALFVILVIVFAVMSSKNWHWSNIVFLSLTAIAAAFAANGMATVFDQRTKAMKDLAKQTERVERSELALQMARSGATLAESYEPGTLRYVDEALSQAMIGRGRAWNGGTASVNRAGDGSVDSITYKFAPGNAEGGDNATAIGLKDYRLFAFAENNVQGVDLPLPENFVGVFRVKDESETGDSLTLELISYGNSEEWKNPSKTWTLFEKMPQDRRGVFREAIMAEAEAKKDNPAFADFQTLTEMFTDDNKKVDITLFRKVLSARYMNAQVLGYDLQNPADAEAYENLLDRYSFDGQNILDIEEWIRKAPNRIAKTFKPLPRETFIKYEFQKETNDTNNPPIKVDEKGKLENSGYFTTNGQAIIPENQNNGDVEFKEKDVVYIDEPSANGYSKGEGLDVPAFNKRGSDENPAVKEIGRFYFRGVQNFPYEYNELWLRGTDLASEIREVGSSQKLQSEINQAALDQLQERTAQKKDATDDNVALKNDFDMIEKLRQQREKELEQARQEIDKLEQEIDAAYLELRKRVLKLSQQAFAAR